MLPEKPSQVIPYEVMENLPFAVSYQLQDLPEEVQTEFLKRFKRLSKSSVVAYVCHIFFSAHYLYLGKILTQLLHWFTMGGFGVWWLIDLFRIPELVKKENERLANRCLQEVMFKHHKLIEKHKLKRNPPKNVLQARQINYDLDPVNIDVTNLQVGYYLDFDLKTWEVRNENQYDWADGVTEKEFKIVSESKTLLLNVVYESALTACYIGEQISLFAIQENLDQEILQKGTPPNILQYGDFRFYKEQPKEGFLFVKAQNQTSAKVLAWDYMDSQRRFLLRIEQTGRNNFRASLSQKTDPMSFSDILPR